jgi:hypothetical protein
VSQFLGRSLGHGGSLSAHHEPKTHETVPLRDRPRVLVYTGPYLFIDTEVGAHTRVFFCGFFLLPIFDILLHLFRLLLICRG